MLTDQLELFDKMQQQLMNINSIRSADINSHIQNLYDEGMRYIYLGMGLGDYDHQLSTGLGKLNRFSLSHGNLNYLKYGYIFITRPKLNLNPYNLKADRILNLLNTSDPNSIQAAIRIMLDTKYANTYGAEITARCPYVDWRSPFFTWIINNITDFSGGPNYQLEVDQDNGGYFGEQQAIALSNNSYAKPFDLSISVDDPYGGPIDAAMFYWTYYMQQQYLGSVIAYPEDIDDQILNYTVSIYRFIVDFSGQYIQRAYKYTGCFPISRPGASVADFSKDQPFVEQARHFTIGFKCGSGHVDERDPMIIKEFNDLCERYYPPFSEFPIAKGVKRKNGVAINKSIKSNSIYQNAGEIDKELETNAKHLGLIRNPLLPDFNYTGLPYITFTTRGPRIDFFREKNEYNIELIKEKINKESKEIQKLNELYGQHMAQIVDNYYTDAELNKTNKDLLTTTIESELSNSNYNNYNSDIIIV